MSDALNYLVNVRPDAMGAYFKFLKKVRGLGKKPYYPPLDLDKPKPE